MVRNGLAEPAGASHSAATRRGGYLPSGHTTCSEGEDTISREQSLLQPEVHSGAGVADPARAAGLMVIVTAVSPLK
jgi:hypothetical protein